MVLITPSDLLLILPFKSPVLLIVPLLSIDLLSEIILPLLSTTPLLSKPPVIEAPDAFAILPSSLFVTSPFMNELLLIVLLLTTLPSTLPSLVNVPLFTVVPEILPLFASSPLFVTVFPSPPLLFREASGLTVTSLFIPATFSTSPAITVVPEPVISLLFVPDVKSSSPLFVTGFPFEDIKLLASVTNVPSLSIVSPIITPFAPLSV